MAGAPDGSSAHLVEQIVAKARLPFVSPVSTDKTVNLANVPWTFSCAPGDHLQAAALAPALIAPAGTGSIAVVSCLDHDARLFTTELLATLSRLCAFPEVQVAFQPGSTEFGWQLERLRQAKPSALALVGGPADAARFLIALRRAGLSMPVFGGPRMGRRLFVDTAGLFADGVVFPLLWHPGAAGERSASFARRFRERSGFEPDYSAAHTYDAVSLLVAAIARTGLNRVQIRDSIRALSPWHGVSGTITWDPTGCNHRPVSLGTIREGRVMPIVSP